MEWFYALRKALTDELEREGQAIADGGAGSWDDYKYRTGVRKGLRRALAVMEDVAKELHGDETDG